MTTSESIGSTERSPLLMARNNTALLVVDVQEKLAPAIIESDRLVWNIGRLVEGAQKLGIPIAVTEQYPKGLGTTVPELSQLVSDGTIYEKRMFSLRECSELIDSLTNKNIKNVLLAGIETHVCVMQSALDLMGCGFDVFVCIDAVSSRHEEDDMTAMQRLETSGATLVTTEMALFEWCETSKADEFKNISRIVQRVFPGDEEMED